MGWHLLISPVVCIAVVWICLRVFVRVSHPFWSRQPVTHHYDMLSYAWLGSVIREHPEAPRPVQHVQVDCRKVVEASEKEWVDMLELQSSSYDSIHAYTPTKRSFSIALGLPYTIAFWCTARGNDGSLLGGITGQAVRLRYLRHTSPAFMVDNLCVRREARKSDVATSLISRTAYEAHKLGVPVCVFKREGRLLPFRPLVTSVAYELLPRDLKGSAAFSDAKILDGNSVSANATLEDLVARSVLETDAAVLPASTHWIRERIGNDSSEVIMCSPEVFVFTQDMPLEEDGVPVTFVVGIIAPQEVDVTKVVSTIDKLKPGRSLHIECIGVAAGWAPPKYHRTWDVSYYAYNMYSACQDPAKCLVLV